MEQGRSSERPRRKKSQRQHDLEFQELVLKCLINIVGISGPIYERISEMVAECRMLLEEEVSEAKVVSRAEDELSEYWRSHRLDH